MPTITGVEAGMVPVLVTARLQQGVVWDAHLGLALDGILASVARRISAAPGTAGSLIDGGLGGCEPHSWGLPLAKCDGGGDWHWACGHGVLLDADRRPLNPGVPDVRQLSQRPDERRAPSVAVRLPADLGGRRGRFRPRLRPVLNTPASYLQWSAVGNPNALQQLLQPVLSVGARRGSGEGAVMSWDVEQVTVEDLFAFTHLACGGLSRPMPLECAEQLGQPYSSIQAGIRPPYFHQATQRNMAIRPPS